MLTDVDKLKIIDWITCGGQSNAIMEDGDVDWDATTSGEIEDFIRRCHQVLAALLQINL